MAPPSGGGLCEASLAVIASFLSPCGTGRLPGRVRAAGRPAWRRCTRGALFPPPLDSRQMVVHPFSRERPSDENTPAGTGWWSVDWRAHQRWLDVGGRPVNTIELG